MLCKYDIVLNWMCTFRSSNHRFLTNLCFIIWF